MLIRDPAALHAAKEARRLSYRQLARLTDVTPGFVYALIPRPGVKPRKRSCTPQVAVRLARALDRDVDELFENRLPTDPSTGDLPLHREDPAPATAPLRMPSVSTDGARNVRGRHRRKDQP